MRTPILQKHGDGRRAAAVFGLFDIRNLEPHAGALRRRCLGKQRREKGQQETRGYTEHRGFLAKRARGLQGSMDFSAMTRTAMMMMISKSRSDKLPALLPPAKLCCTWRERAASFAKSSSLIGQTSLSTFL